MQSFWINEIFTSSSSKGKNRFDLSRRLINIDSILNTVSTKFLFKCFSLLYVLKTFTIGPGCHKLHLNIENIKLLQINYQYLTYSDAAWGRPSTEPKSWVASKFVTPSVASSGFDLDDVNWPLLRCILK